MMGSGLLESLAQALLARGERLCTAESCTGGGIAADITDLSGSSGWFECGWVTYSNASKTALLGVEPALLQRHGAVSAEVARAMCEGALARCTAGHALSVTGIAGPGGGSAEKPVGLVWFGWMRRGQEAATECRVFPGDRQAVRAAARDFALARLLERLGG
jgi:nicotinamide-nucleotide amidase